MSTNVRESKVMWKMMTIATIVSPLLMQRAVAQAPRGVADTAMISVSDSEWNVLKYRLNAATQRTPAELFADVALYRRRVAEPLSPALPVYPFDSLRALPGPRARLWVDSVESARERIAQWLRAPISGMQLEPLAALAVVARQDSLARQQLAARLATPGLSPPERAHALFTGAEAFADRLHPERLPFAEQYIAQLHTLGAVGAPWELMQRLTLAHDVYYWLGRRDDVLKHASAIVSLLPTMEYEDRRLLFDYPGEFIVMMADLLSGTAKDRARFAALDTQLLAAVKPDDGNWRARVATGFAQAHMLGRPAPRLQANVWMNTAASTTAPMTRFDDGVVRVVSFTALDDANGLLTLQRIQDRFGQRIQMVALSRVNGYWGYRFITPAQEAQLQIQAFHALKLTFPIGFWVQDKQLQEDGGMRVPYDPTMVDYHVSESAAYGQVFVIDGRGRVRYMTDGVDRGNEEDIEKSVTTLLHEGSAHE